jgi:single-strand DNA-binding protein
MEQSMSSINKIFLLGRVGQDPEGRHMPSGDMCVSFSLATSTYSNKSGERKEFTEWHKCVCFNKAAEVANSYIRKGSLVHLEGSIKTNKWTDKEGNPKATTEIVVGRLTILSKKEDGHTAPAKQSESPFPDLDDEQVPF